MRLCPLHGCQPQLVHLSSPFELMEATLMMFHRSKAAGYETVRDESMSTPLFPAAAAAGEWDQRACKTVGMQYSAAQVPACCVCHRCKNVW